MTIIRKLAGLLAAMFAVGVLATAHAQTDPALAQAKAQGVIGEMYTGYLGVADEARATPDLRRRLQETNAKRLQVYTETSRRTGDTVEVIAALTAEKQIARAGSGERVKPGASAAWREVP